MTYKEFVIKVEEYAWKTEKDLTGWEIVSRRRESAQEVFFDDHSRFIVLGEEGE